MEQVRVILKLLWRERFWVLSVVGVLVAVVCWQLSSSALDAEFTTRKNAIQNQFNAMRNLSQETPHPNDKVIQGNREQAREQVNNVLAVWQELYDRQRKEVLFWPEDSLKPQFIETIEKLKFRDPFPVSQAEDMRTHYWNYIGRRFDGLLKIVKALNSEGGRGRFFRGRAEGSRGYEGEGLAPPRTTIPGDNAEQDHQDYLVQWLDQGNLRSKLQFSRKPKALEIWVTQEDLWVYETLLNVIAKTNELRGATRPDNTAVRVIVNLEVGRDAAIASREKAEILMPGGMGGAGRERMYEAEGGGEMASLRRREDDFAERETGDAAVLAYRYLDPEGNPYPGEPEDREYRCLPVRMRLMMDQRYLPQLLVQCANAALPVEVKQVRVNPDKSASDFGGSRYGSSRGAFGDMSALADDSNLADVEIRGVVYIYNQPDRTILQELGGEDGQLADASSSGQ